MINNNVYQTNLSLHDKILLAIGKIDGMLNLNISNDHKKNLTMLAIHLETALGSLPKNEARYEKLLEMVNDELDKALKDSKLRDNLNFTEGIAV